MKQFFSYLGASLAAIAALVSCNKEIDAPVEDLKGGVPFEICASTADTKTAIKDLTTSWVAADSINLFHAVADATSYTSDGKFTISEENLSSKKFTGKLASTLEPGNYDWYAFYPYNKYITTPANTSSGWVTVGGTTQTQEGNDSMAHLCGDACPLYGVAAGVASDVVPSIEMKHLTSIIEVNVTNNSGEDLTVTNVTFTGSENIVGTYYINFAGTSVDYTASNEKYVSTTASLSISNGAAIGNGSSAKFYIAVKPFTATSTQTLKLSVNGYEKEISHSSDVTFTAGKIKKINFNYDYDPSKNVDATFDFTNSTEFSSQSINAPSSGDGVNIDGKTITKSDIGLSFAQGTSAYIRWWNANGTLELRTYVGNELSFTAPDGFNIVKIKLSSSHTYTANTGTFSSDTWTGEASEVTLTRGGSGTHKVSSITVHCKKAATGIVSTSTDEAVQGGVDLTKDITLTNYDSAPSLTATPDGVVVTAASVGSITTTGATVTYTLAPNYATSTKAGTITIDDGAGHSGTITVNQPAAVFSVSETSLILGAASGSSATITVTSDYDWTVVDDLISGFTVSPASFTYSGAQAQTVTITATAANETASTVDLGMFTFKRAGDNAETDVITISQASANPADVKETIDFEAENFSTFYTGWTFTNLSRANAITAKAGSYYATNSSSTTASVQTKTIIASPKSLKCYYSKSTNNTNNSSKFIIQVSKDGKNWTDVSTGSTMNNVTKGTWYELKADLTSYSNVYVRVYYSGTNTTRCLDEIEFIYKNPQQQ